MFGFSVIEVLIVIAIIALLVSMLLPAIAAAHKKVEAQQKAQEDARRKAQDYAHEMAIKVKTKAEARAQARAEFERRKIEDKEQAARNLVNGVASGYLPVKISSNIFYFANGGKEFSVFVMENVGFGDSNSCVKMNVYRNTRKTMANYCPDFPWVMGVTNGFFVEIERVY